MDSSNHPLPVVSTENRFSDDRPLQALLARHVSPSGRALSEPWLREMGRLSAGPIDELAFQADANPPVLERYDRRGDRADRVVYHAAYRGLEEMSFGRGIVGNFYDERNRVCLGPHEWQVKFAMCYLFAQAEQGVYCPIAMTDAAAHLLERNAVPELQDKFLPGLTASRLEDLKTGAMFLTEREGGSDVGANTATARAADGGFRITGDKWFCSNVSAGIMMVLARVVHADGGTVPGTRGLGLFLVPATLDDGSPNALRIKRLKNKLGTRSMPTGEVSLRDAVGYPVGPVSEGFRIMTGMLNVCRMHNAVAALALTRRVLWEAAEYAAQRKAFGKPVDSYLLVQDLLCGLFAELEAGLEILFSVGLDFQDGGSDAETLGCLRLMTPLLKLNTAKLAVRAASEAVELLGGNGFIEEYVTARFYRDAQVLPVWEGTTNILYLDALRWIVKAKAHRAVGARIERLLAPAAATPLGEVVENLRQQNASLQSGFEQLDQVPQEAAPLAVKRLCDALWPLYGLARLLPHAGNNYRVAAVVHRLLMKMSGPAAPLQPEELPQAYQAIVRDACSA